MFASNFCFHQSIQTSWGREVLFVYYLYDTFNLLDIIYIQSCIQDKYVPILCRDSNLTILNIKSYEDVTKTTCVIRYGAFKFLVIPLGLTNASITFYTLINQVFHNFLDKFFVSITYKILRNIQILYNKFEKQSGRLLCRAIFQSRDKTLKRVIFFSFFLCFSIIMNFLEHLLSLSFFDDLSLSSLSLFFLSATNSLSLMIHLCLLNLVIIV